MPAIILPPKFLPLLAAFEPSFCAANYRNFSVQVAGWIHRLGRHTITAVASAAGAVCRHHISVFHRFFERARWKLDAFGRVVFALALSWIPADQPVFVLGDDTLAVRPGHVTSVRVVATTGSARAFPGTCQPRSASGPSTAQRPLGRGDRSPGQVLQNPVCMPMHVAR